jgi:hypothetical protein
MNQPSSVVGAPTTTKITTETTEWDDILVRKKVVSREQVMLAKGFTTEQVVEMIADEVTAAREAEATEAAELADSALDASTRLYADKTLDELDELEV